MTKKKRTLIIRIILFSGTIISLFFVPWILLWAWILPIPSTIQEQADQVIDFGFEGVVVYIDQNGKPPQFVTAGWHNRDTKIPAKHDALYPIASISKLYDVMAITKLVTDGRLALDGTLANYMPDLKGRIEYADEITLQHMIQHRSGIPNFTDTPGFWASPTQSFEESLALILDMPANFEPGEDYEYCNTNYILLQKIMDNELGYGYFDFVKDEILLPNNLNSTYGPGSMVNIDELMSGYHQGYPYDLKNNGHMMATAEDVGLFVRALNDGSLFENGEQENYVYEYEHSGWIPGYQSFAKYDKDLDAVIVLFYSTTDDKLYLWNLSEIFNNRFIKILKRNRSLP